MFWSRSMTASSLVGLAGVGAWGIASASKYASYRYARTGTLSLGPPPSYAITGPSSSSKINLNYSLTPQIPSYRSRRQQNTLTQPCFSAYRGSGSSPRLRNSAAPVLCWRITGELIITPIVDDNLTLFLRYNILLFMSAYLFIHGMHYPMFMFRYKSMSVDL